jgi:hypothetical protein
MKVLKQAYTSVYHPPRQTCSKPLCFGIHLASVKGEREFDLLFSICNCSSIESDTTDESSNAAAAAWRLQHRHLGLNLDDVHCPNGSVPCGSALV